jgi:hypothetical protein
MVVDPGHEYHTAVPHEVHPARRGAR